MERRQSEIDRESKVKDVASRLRQFEDHNLAIRLQEEEFNQHYQKNRSERRVMGVDTRKSKEEQELERKYALEKRLAECREIAAKDETIARQIQIQLEEDERRLKQQQALMDQEIARQMQARYEPPPVLPPPQPYQEDEVLARELQERYFRRLRSTQNSLDEQTRNQLNRYIESQTIPPPDSLLPRNPPSRNVLPSQNFSPTHFPLMELIPPSSTALSPSHLPPLPSYTEACTPTSQGLTNTITDAPPVRSFSPTTTQLLTTTAAVTHSTREPLHEILISDNTTVASTNSSLFPVSSSVNNMFNPALLQNLHPTNPFKDSLEAEYRANHPNSPVNQNSPNVIGLPPFSDLLRTTTPGTLPESPSTTQGPRVISNSETPVLPFIANNTTNSNK